MNYLQVLTRALAISWRHKYLWLLALFAGEATTVGLNFQNGPGNRSGRHNTVTQADWNQFTSWLGAHAALLWTVGITVALLCIALFLVSAVANGALVKASAEHDAERPFGLGQAWSAGVHSFGPVLRLKLFALLVFVSLAIVIGGLGLMTAVFALTGAMPGAVATGALGALLLLAAIPFAIVFGVAVLLGVRAIVLDGKGASDGLRAALHLIWRRRGRIALFWLLVGIAGVIASAAVWFAVLVAALPVVVLTAAAYFTGGLMFAIATGIGFGTAWLIVVVAFLGGVNAFTSTCWTVAYTRFDLEPQPAAYPQPQPA